MENEKTAGYVIGYIDAARPKSDADTMREFEEAIQAYKDLVRRGWAKPRGYTLATIEDMF